MKRTLIAIFLLIVAGALQSRAADQMKISGSAPDFLMAATIAMGLLLDPALGAVFGFGAGLVQASIVGLSFGGFIASRTLLGFGVGSLRLWFFQENPLVLVAACLLGTIACEGLLFLIEPVRSSSAAIAQLPMESVYNAVLALVCYFLMRRAMEPRRKELEVRS
ncbi:MAG: rod shape-determining protein MreD [Armatimonadota bacterium]|nr:rod shape-determining protein MreD [Armatimonadota bacterium]